MNFEWDDDKNAANLTKHGIAFEEAATIFDGEHLSFEDRRIDYGELRLTTLGRLAGEVIIVVVHTDRDERIRIISARKANKHERKVSNDYYEETQI